MTSQNDHPADRSSLGGLPDFDDADLAAAVDQLPRAALDRLPFGVVRLDAAGRVVIFSTTEAKLSGYGGRPTLGLDFFTDIAPCMNQPSYRGRIEQGVAAGTLNARFTWVGDFDDREKVIQVRLHGIAGGGCWIFMHRHG